MTKINISGTQLKKLIDTAKIVKPIFGDYSVLLTNGEIRISSLDKRRCVLAISQHNSGIDIEEEFFLPADRVSLLEYADDLDMILSDKGLSIKYVGNGVTKSALLKRRAGTSKRPGLPSRPSTDQYYTIKSDTLNNILKNASCSASIKETNTEEDMRVNQVHFYSHKNSVFANARYHASFIKSDSIDFDISLISSDIPLIRNFCDRLDGNIKIYQSDNKLCFEHEISGSYVQFHSIDTKKPDYKLPSLGEVSSTISLSYENLKSALKWALLTLEGTQRITISTSKTDESNTLAFKSSDQVLASFPVDLSGPGFTADFPIKILFTICEYLSDDDVVMKYGMSSLPDVLLIQQTFPDMLAQHFIRSMKSK